MGEGECQIEMAIIAKVWFSPRTSIWIAFGYLDFAACSASYSILTRWFYCTNSQIANKHIDKNRSTFFPKQTTKQTHTQTLSLSLSFILSILSSIAIVRFVLPINGMRLCNLEALPLLFFLLLLFFSV